MVSNDLVETCLLALAAFAAGAAVTLLLLGIALDVALRRGR